MRDIEHKPADPVSGPSEADLHIQDLVAKAKLGDEYAFADLYAAHRDRIFAVAMRMLKHREDAEDATQDTFAKAWRYLPKFRGDAKFSTWAHKICVRECLQKLRYDKSRPQTTGLEEIVIEPAVETDFTSKLTLKDISDKLDLIDKVLIRLRLQGVTFGEMEGLWGLSVPGCKARVQRVREYLRGTDYHGHHRRGRRRNSR